MNKKIRYRTVPVEQFDATGALEGWSPTVTVVVAIDVAKTKFVAAISASAGDTPDLVAWEHPRQTAVFLELIGTLATAGRQVVAVLEPTGTYGDALRHQLSSRSVEVRRVSPKQVHDAAELLDGVPSKHDAKDARLISWLHFQGKSHPWPPANKAQRMLRALVDERELYFRPMQAALGMLEALNARHFPELGRAFDVPRRRSLWAVLEAFPAPADIARDPEAVRSVLRKASHGQLTRRADELVAIAMSSTGAPMDEHDKRLVQHVVREVRRCQLELDRVDAEIKGAVDVPPLAPLRDVLGPVTTAVIVAHLGSPADYGSAAAFQKACGLNLKERSSGQHIGKLHITKRGPGIVRKYLYLAALRLVQSDPVVRAWYLARAAHRAEAKSKAVIAVVRKLALALVHVARGAPFDAARLFDTRRLDSSASPDTPTFTEAAA